MKLAVIRTGSKQYKVKEGDKIKIEKIKGEVNDKIELDDILLLSDGDKVDVGIPKLDKKITANIIKQSRAKKVRVVKYKAKTRYQKAYGHRQHFTELEINKI